MRTKEELIELRKEYLDPDEAEKVHEELKKILKKEYKPKHKPAEYYRLIRDWDVDAVEEQNPQDTNDPETIYECFSVVSQHVNGVTKEHCYDQIWDVVQEKKKRLARYKLLPTLEELVNSDTPIDPELTYQWKDKDDKIEDSCSGYSGDIILKMREVGINEYRKIMWKEAAEAFGFYDPCVKEIINKSFEKYLKSIQA